MSGATSHPPTKPPKRLDEDTDLKARAAALVKGWPPLTAEQKDQLRLLFRSSEPVRRSA
jgi:hypothetical protein